MPLNVSKDCFPAPSECHNCKMKRSNLVKKKLEDKKDYKRCGNCHLMTYCDKDCQREHWTKVHKKHCRFLSGKAPVKNCKHNAATCSLCIDQTQSSYRELRSVNSPKTVCSVEEVTGAMKTSLGALFGFHGEGNRCKCSIKFACELPFPLGEESGQYFEIANTGLDNMLAHILKLLNAMIYKAKTKDHKNALIQMWTEVIKERSLLWCEFLVREMPFNSPRGQLYDQVDGLQNIFGASSPWWQALKFSVHFAEKTCRELTSHYHDSPSLEDSRFQTLKLINDYQLYQLRNQAIVSKNKMWPKFMLWPEIVDSSMAILLPPGSHCQNCSAELCGQATIAPQGNNTKTLPSLFWDVADGGALMAICSVAKNPINCRVNCLFKNVANQLMANKAQYNAMVKENELFGIMTRDCDYCFKSTLTSHRCSACLTVQYCSTGCQKEDLVFHTSVCEMWAKDKSRRIPGKQKQKDHWKSYFGEQ